MKRPVLLNTRIQGFWQLSEISVETLCYLNINIKHKFKVIVSHAIIFTLKIHWVF
jgi:hypothetical protein